MRMLASCVKCTALIGSRKEGHLTPKTYFGLIKSFQRFDSAYSPSVPVAEHCTDASHDWPKAVTLFFCSPHGKNQRESTL